LGLTAREKQILRLKKGALSDYEIARKPIVHAGTLLAQCLTAASLLASSALTYHT